MRLRASRFSRASGPGHGVLAQLVERQVRNLKVRGSTPLCSTRGSAGKADPRRFLDMAYSQSPELAAQARHLAPGHYYTRGPAAPKPLSDSAPPTSFVTATKHLCPLPRKVPRPPAGPLTRTAAHPASTIDPVSARKKLPTTQNITPPHQAIGSIRFPHRSACLKCFRLGRFPRRISRPEDFRQGRS